MIFAPPLQLMELARHKLELDDIPCSLKYIVTGGVPVFQKHFDVLNAAFPNATVFPIYGQTEAGLISTFKADHPEDLELFKKNPLSVGKIVPEYVYQVSEPLENSSLLTPLSDCRFGNGRSFGPEQTGRVTH